MKRTIFTVVKRINGKLEYNETGRYLINNVPERYFFKFYEEQQGDFIKVAHLSSYQICNVYTNKNKMIPAYLKLNGDRAIYSMAFDHNEVKLTYALSEIVLNQIKVNTIYNCHGLTFLDRKFWLELDNETLDTILKDDKYVKCSFENLKEGGIALYYNKSGVIHHSARIMNGNLISKLGVNDTITTDEVQLLDFYKDKLDLSLTQYYNP